MTTAELPFKVRASSGWRREHSGRKPAADRSVPKSRAGLARVTVEQGQRPRWEDPSLISAEIHPGRRPGPEPEDSGPCANRCTPSIGIGGRQDHCTRAFLDGMIEQNSGKIIVVASDAGRVGSLGETVYSAAKGGAIAFCKSLAREVARFKINVNSVCPGPTDTPLLAAVPEKHQEAFIRATPLRRLAKPEELADAVLFFASDQSSFITGQVLSVSGGLVIPG